MRKEGWMRTTYLTSALFLLLTVFPAPASSSYEITLQNGESVQAEAYNIEAGRITLVYKLGRASFPDHMVKSIKDESGKAVDFLSSAGTPSTEPPEHAAESTVAVRENVNRPGGSEAAEADGSGRRMTVAGLLPASGEAVPDETPGPSRDDKEFYEGMTPDEKAFMKGEKDITEME